MHENSASLHRVAFVAAFPVNRYPITRGRSTPSSTSTATTRVVYLKH